MYKELAIVLCVIAIIIIGNVITQNNTNCTVEEMINKLSAIKKEINKNDIEKQGLKEKVKNLEKYWEIEQNKMAYYIEHDELEKVSSEIIKLRADIEMNETEMSVENLENCIFILEHIKDKSTLKIVNIF